MTGRPRCRSWAPRGPAGTSGPVGFFVGVAVGVGVGVAVWDGDGAAVGGAGRVVTSTGGWVHHPQLSGPLHAWMRNLYVVAGCKPVNVCSFVTPMLTAWFHGGSGSPFRQNSTPYPVSGRPPSLGGFHLALTDVALRSASGKCTFDTMPGVPTRVAPRDAADAAGAPRTPAGAPSGIASTVSAWLTEASAASAPLRRTAAVSVPSLTAQA